ncbi:NADH-quinone oxidoreductase subunit N [Mycolicibacterium litorale]|nr:NADH-quinone oxidoreductase subunit N [Mycolicibacterium litorale]
MVFARALFPGRRSPPVTPPSIEYGQLSPMLIVLGAAVAGVLVEAFAPRADRFRWQLGLCLAGLCSALVAVAALAGTVGSAVSGAVVSDGPASFLQGVVLVVGLAAVALVAERDSGASLSFTAQASTVPGSVAERTAVRAGGAQTEVFPLTLFAVAGMLVFVAAGDLLTMFVALEVFSLPLYLMCGLARRRRLLSQEAALKYFLLGAFSSAFFLYGIAMLYGSTGTLTLTGIATTLATHTDHTTLTLLGTALLTAGILFKIGAVPFHSWIPDVYQGAPTPITAFMAAATKVAAFGAMLRIFYVALPTLSHNWRPILSMIAMVTMIGGAVLAVSQTDLKRLLGYSAVAQAGFILTGVVAGDGAGLSATLFYLATYALTTLGAFAVVSLVRDEAGGEQTAIANWAGIGRRHPLTALVFTVFLLALAGIPLTSGFIGKFAVFAAAAHSGQVMLVLIGVIASAVTVFVYARVAVVMYDQAAPIRPAIVRAPSRLTATAILFGVVVTIAFGVLPQPLLDMAHRAGDFLR